MLEGRRAVPQGSRSASCSHRATGGAIVNIGSVSSHRPQPNNAAYVGAIDTPMIRGVLETAGFTAAELAPVLSLNVDAGCTSRRA